MNAPLPKTRPNSTSAALLRISRARVTLSLHLGGCETGFVLSINGVSYTGTAITGIADADSDPCLQSCFERAAFGTLYGEVIFNNVPICE